VVEEGECSGEDNRRWCEKDGGAEKNREKTVKITRRWDVGILQN